MDRQTLLDKIRQSRLLSENQLTAVAGRAADEAPQALIDSLVGAELLTEFQAKRIWDGKTDGLVLGQYRMLDELGRGGFGRVYKALHTVMDRIVAVKVIAPELVEDERARTWFKREVLAVTQLSHPNIVMAYDANETDGALFLVMEYIDGANLDTFVRKQGPLSIGLACEMMRQAALGLQHAHEKGMVHRDVKPANLLIPRAALAQLPGGLPDLLARPAQGSPPPLVKVVDFGLARLHNTGHANTLQLQNEKSFLGTPDYVSPEQAYNVHAVDIRSDLYSLGCTFYHALTGQRPFRGTTALETVVKHLKDDAKPLEELRPETPAAVGAIIRRLMAKDPAKRFQTPSELIGELEFLCGQDKPRLMGSLTPAALPLSSPRMRAPLTTGPEAAPVLAATAMISNLGVPAVAEAEAPDTPADPVLSATVATALPLERPSPEAPPVVDPVPAEPPPERTPLSAEEMALLDADLRQAWQRWTAVVEAYSLGRRSARVREPEYRQLHGQLLGLCRAQIDNAEGVQRERFRLLEGMVEPWLTPRTLAAADRDTLAGLLHRCKQIEHDLGASRGGGVMWLWMAVLLLLGVAGGLGWQLYRQQRGPAPARTWLAGLWKVVEANPVLWAALVVPAVVLLAIGLLARRFRT